MGFRFIRLVLLALVTGSVYAYVAFRSSERSWYEGLLPRGLNVEAMVALGTQGGFREGCGAVVFKLDSATTGAVRRDGLAALSIARQARAESDPYFSYDEWNQTPYVETGDGLTLKDRWLNGLSCAALDPNLAKIISRALDSEGSFYSRGRESGLVVLPTEGLIVLSFEG